MDQVLGPEEVFQKGRAGGLIRSRVFSSERSDPEPGLSEWSDPVPGFSEWSDPEPGFSEWSDPDPKMLYPKVWLGRFYNLLEI